MRPLDDRDGWIWQDGELVPWRAARIHVLSHGLHYGTAVFEGIRAYGGRAFRLEDHMARLVRSAELIGLDLGWTVARLTEAARACLEVNEVADGYIRPIAWRGSEALGLLAPETRTQIAMAVWSWPAVFGAEARADGIALATAAWRRPSAAFAPAQAKATGLYLLGVLARQQAAAAGFDDALMLTGDGHLAEASGANLFIVEQGRLLTPEPTEVLDGITRQTIITLARADGIEVVEQPLAPERLAGADEVFLTGTAYEVQPVRRVDGRRFAVGPVTRRLQARYEACKVEPWADGGAGGGPAAASRVIERAEVSSPGR